jgi:uncharacterized membrane protein YidH (DUF202 family)
MKKFIALGASFLLPAIVLAVGNPTFNYTQSVISQIRGLINMATPVVIGLAFLFFLWGLMKFVLAAGNEDKREEGKKIMIWGIVAIFIMVSVWGIVQLLQTETGTGGGGIIQPPAI